MTTQTLASDLHGDLLKRVSRSIYLSLKALPRPIREQMGLGYLFCRAADTIADTRLVPKHQRMKCLDLFQEPFEKSSTGVHAFTQIQAVLEGQQNHPHEKLLLTKLQDCLRAWQSFDPVDRDLIRDVVFGVIQGMRMDITLFGGNGDGQVCALSTLSELDRYCYFIGGCPGIFWTKLCFRHLKSLHQMDMKEMLKTGTDFGKGLQMTNILRDLAVDLRNGRCYIPRSELNKQGLSPFDLLHPEAWPRLQPIYGELIDKTRDLLHQGSAYVLELPRREIRLRLACTWPLLTALKTLALLTHSSLVLDPNKTIKISRRELYKLIVASTAAVPSNKALTRLYRKIKG